MSISKKFCSLEDVKGNSTTDKEGEMQEYEKRILQCVLAEKITPMDLKNWLVFHSLEPEFISEIHMVVIYSISRAIVVMKDKNVYSLYLKSEMQATIHSNKIKELCGKNIKTFAHGAFFMLVLTEEGKVYSCALAKKNRMTKRTMWSDYTKLIIPEESTFTQVTSKKRIIDISCGDRHCLALTSDGKVYAWGYNDYGQVGKENTAGFTRVPWEVTYELKNKNVIHIACGSTFNIVITDENIIYGWGDNSSGQISTVQSQKYYVYPHEIITNYLSDKIVKVTCGTDHTLALTNKGDIYAWGNNHFGQIGINTSGNFPPILVNVPKMGKVLDIAALHDSSVAVGYDGTTYVWGKFFYHKASTTPFPIKFARIHDVFAYNGQKIIHKPLTIFTNNCEYDRKLFYILESLEAAFDNKLTSDFTIQVKEQPIYVHKAILQIRSEYFKKMFQHDWAENIQSTSDSSSVLTVSDFSYIVYKAFLKYLYTDTIDLPSENALELMKLADMYCETNHLKDCSKIIKKTITVSNVAFFYNKAIEYNAKELEEFCFQFALHHMMVDTLLEDMNMQTKFMHKTRSCVLLSRRYHEKSSVLRKRYAEKRNSRTNEEHKMQKYENKTLQCVLAKNIISTYLRNWPFFRLQEPEFILQIHMVMIFSHGHRAIIVTKDKNVYSLNYPSEPTSVLTALYPKKIKELCGKNIKTFTCGLGFILALTEEGEVYSCEFINSNRDLLNISEDATFTQVADLSEKCVVDIACECRYSLALTSDGKVYAWELNINRIKSYYIGAAFSRVPMQVKYELQNKNVVHIACGLNFNIVITDENIIYGWGDNSSGQISTNQSHTRHVYPHKIIRISNKIVKVTCGNSHTLVLTNKGEIYAWGKNIWGQIGVDSNYKNCAPIKVNRPEMGKVLDIAALCELSVAVGYDKIIYIWGKFCTYYVSNIPFPTKFLTIHDVFAYSDLKILDKPLTVFMNIEEELNILESIGTAFDDPLTSDFIIQVKGQPIYVHKAILQIRSEYFKKMFQHDRAENIQSTSDSSSVLTVSDFSYIVYKAFLKYLYTDTIDLPSENALELMELAHMYCETSLIKDCSKVIKKESSLCQM